MCAEYVCANILDGPGTSAFVFVYTNTGPSQYVCIHIHKYWAVSVRLHSCTNILDSLSTSAFVFVYKILDGLSTSAFVFVYTNTRRSQYVCIRIRV